jgi:sulfate adenylyltransferase subunit 1
LFTAIDFRVDISTQEKLSGINELQLNDIAQVQLKTASPLVYESYAKNKVLGSLIFVDPFTFETVGAGMIL